MDQYHYTGTSPPPFTGTMSYPPVSQPRPPSARKAKFGEYEEGCLLMRPPKAWWDTKSKSKATILTVDSANRDGSLLEIVQLLDSLDLDITKATISSDGCWLLDIFHIVDHLGNKVEDESILQYINAVIRKEAEGIEKLGQLRTSLGRPVKRLEALGQLTAIELIGNDRAGLLSECAGVLARHNYAVVASALWTFAGRIASIVYVTDEKEMSDDELEARVPEVTRMLSDILVGERRKKTVKPKVNFTTGLVQPERRLHQMLFADRDYDENASVELPMDVDALPSINVRNCTDTNYTVVYIRSADRPKLLFDALCTLTDMAYNVFHATIDTVDGIAEQEYYIKDMDSNLLVLEAERNKVVKCLLAAIQRRNPEGVCLMLNEEDKPGLLLKTTDMFRLHNLSITKAEIDTIDGQAVNIFFVTAADGSPADMEILQTLQQEIGPSLSIKLPEKQTPPRPFIVERTVALMRSVTEFFQLLRVVKS